MQKFKVLSSKKQRKADKAVRVTFPEPLYERMLEAFAQAEAGSREGYAIAQCGYMVDGTRKRWSYMVRSLHLPSKEDLFEQSSITVTPRAGFIEAVMAEAAAKNNVILEVHTHVGSAEPNFSWLDIENGLENGRFLRSCGLRFAMAVAGRSGFSFAEYDADHDAIQMPESARIGVIGRRGQRDAMVHKSISSCEICAKAGPEGMHVAIGGLDGVGFNVLLLLARHGVKNFIIIDDGVIDESHGALPYKLEAGKKRTKAAYSMLKKVSRDVMVARVSGACRDVAGELKECDAIFYCGVDGAMGSALNEASLKYFIPLVEARTLTKGDGPCGRVRVFIPSITGCPGCVEDPAGSIGGLAADRMDEAVAALAVQEFMDVISGGVPGTQSMARKSITRVDSCPLCGTNGILGAGDGRKLKR